MTDRRFSLARAPSWVLAASLFLNVVLIGGGAGYVFSVARTSTPLEVSQGEPPMEAGRRGLGPLGFMGDPRALITAFPPDIRQDVRAQIARAGEEALPVMREAGAARRELRALMREGTYDRAALQDAFARMRSADAQLTELGHNAWLSVLDGLSAEERRAALMRMRRGEDYLGRPLARRGAKDMLRDEVAEE